MSLSFSKLFSAHLSIAAIALLSSCKVTDVSDEEQSASLAPYSDHKIKDATLEEHFGGRTAFLVGAEDLEINDPIQEPSSDDPSTFDASISVKFNSSDSMSVGTAVAIDPRGYFVTAGHCVNGREMYALYVDKDGKLAIEKIRTVWVRISSLPEIDFALFRVKGKPYQTFEWADSLEIDETVFSAGTTFKVNEGEDPLFSLTTDSFAGALKKTRDVNFKKSEFQLIWHRSPVRKGNSGGPLINEAGELIGVNYAASSPIQRTAGAEMPPMGYAIRPDLDWVRDLIEEDWAKRPEN